PWPALPDRTAGARARRGDPTPDGQPRPPPGASSAFARTGEPASAAGSRRRLPYGCAALRSSSDRRSASSPSPRRRAPGRRRSARLGTSAALPAAGGSERLAGIHEAMVAVRPGMRLGIRLAACSELPAKARNEPRHHRNATLVEGRPRPLGQELVLWPLFANLA